MSFDLRLFDNCTSIHIEVANMKRTVTIDPKINKELEPIGDACLVRALLQVPTVPASFHIGNGDSYYGDDGDHQHLAYVLRDRNVSHVLNRITFGDLMNLESPTDNISVILPKPTADMITYFIQLIPVRKGRRLGYQAVASQAKTNREKMHTNGIAGIVFEGNFAPVALVFAGRRTHVIELVCHDLAVFGCTFIFARFADYIIARIRRE
jgi:hypothetical protein